MTTAPWLTEDDIRGVRRAYDGGLAPGDRAVLRRCRDRDDVLLEGAFWQVVAGVTAQRRPSLATTVLLFAAAPQRRSTGRFRTGAFLRAALYPGKRSVKAAEATRFRQLLQSRDESELAHRMRRLLAHADAPVDWGVLGHDLVRWQPAGLICRAWSQDFYAPLADPKGGPHD
jgi:CRISPR type I-E-associated protein CasB/Cse2